MAPFQRVQNAVVRMVKRLGSRDHITEARRNLHWLPIKYRVIAMTSYITKISSVCYYQLRRLKQVEESWGKTLQLVLCRLSLSDDWITVMQSWQACHSQP